MQQHSYAAHDGYLGYYGIHHSPKDHSLLWLLISMKVYYKYIYKLLLSLFYPIDNIVVVGFNKYL